MPATKSKKQAPASIISLEDLRDRADRIRQDVEEAVETISKRAVGYLPDAQRKQVDEVIDRLADVRDDVTKVVDSWRTDVEKQLKAIRGTVDKRVTSIRKQTETRRKKAVTGFEKEARKYASSVFKRLQIPVSSDLNNIKRRLSAIERRITALEKTGAKSSEKKAAA